MSNGGAIYDFDIIRFGGPTVPDEFDVVVGVTATRILTNDPDRLLVVISNNDAGPVYISGRPFSSVLSGQSIGSGIAYILQVQNDGARCGTNIWGIAPAGPYTVHVQILRRQSKAG